MSLVNKIEVKQFRFFRHEHRIDTTKSWSLDLCLDIGPWNQDPSHGTWDFGSETALQQHRIKQQEFLNWVEADDETHRHSKPRSKTRTWVKIG